MKEQYCIQYEILLRYIVPQQIADIIKIVSQNKNHLNTIHQDQYVVQIEKLADMEMIFYRLPSSVIKSNYVYWLNSYAKTLQAS